MKYFDPITKQLVYVSTKSTPDYWDAHWRINDNIRDKILSLKGSFVSRITRRYLNPGDGPILEGGCGTGQFIASLMNSGYRAIGLDFAVHTVRMLNRFVPELEIIVGDVRGLPFPDEFFSGYWSLGVIEHFWDGYNDIAREMSRVIKPNGYLFLTFPYMSPLRRLKALLNLYKDWDVSQLKDFHQFALTPSSVKSKIEGYGLKYKKSLPHDAVTGAQSEIPFLNVPLQILLNYAPQYKICGYLDTLFNKLFSPFAAHCTLLVFRKE